MRGPARDDDDVVVVAGDVALVDVEDVVETIVDVEVKVDGALRVVRIREPVVVVVVTIGALVETVEATVVLGLVVVVVRVVNPLVRMQPTFLLSSATRV